MAGELIEVRPDNTLVGVDRDMYLALRKLPGGPSNHLHAAIHEYLSRHSPTPDASS